VSCMEPPRWAKLCRALGLEELVPYQYDRPHYPEMIRRFGEVFLTRDRDEWWELFREDGDIAGVPMNSFADVAQDPHFRERGTIAEVGQVDGEPVRMVGMAPRLSDGEWTVDRLGPVPGEHTEEVLGELGYSSAEIAALRQEGAVS
jgi:alpha-methylacyl-CoA racemase